MEQVRQDRRVGRTKKAIRNATVELLSEKELSDITIQELAARADINRKTFYHYYGGVYQVIDEIEHEIIAAFEEVLQSIDFERRTQVPYEIFSRLNAKLNTDLAFYGRLMRMNLNESLVSRITAALKQKTEEVALKRLALEDWQVHLFVEYSISGMLAVYHSWFCSEGGRSLEQFSEEVARLVFGGLNGLLHIGTQGGGAKGATGTEEAVGRFSG